MFKYNELSDLKTGELVTPIQGDGNKIICLNQNLEKVIYTFDDFDFDKTEDERSFIVDDGSSDDSSDVEEVLPEEESPKKEHWINDNGDKYQILYASGYKPHKTLRSVNIIQSIITN